MLSQPSGDLAVVDGLLLRIGDTVEGLRPVKIEKDAAVFRETRKHPSAHGPPGIRPITRESPRFAHLETHTIKSPQHRVDVWNVVRTMGS